MIGDLIRHREAHGGREPCGEDSHTMMEVEMGKTQLHPRN
jgi:hypothetical protein